MNGENRLYRGDCLDVLRRLESERITPDLIYLDPPVYSSHVYKLVFRTSGEHAQQTALIDIWGDSPEQSKFTKTPNSMNINEEPKQFMEMWIANLIKGRQDDRHLLNYLVYMAERLVLMNKVLSSTGSIYLHCDPNTSHYLKIIMDAIFGRDNFRNEIIWHYRTPNFSKKQFAKKHDVILFYSKSKKWNFEPQKEKSYLSHKYGFKNLVIEEDSGGFYRYVLCRDVWDIAALHVHQEESMGYCTQKPKALLHRIISASCPEGGLVFDPFCGGGTTIEVAHDLNRKWIGADISSRAIQHIEARLESRSHIVKTRDYKEIECDPQTRQQYDRLSPYEKQKYLVEKVGGVVGKPGPDGGIDGTIRIHLGGNNNKWGDFIISVKTGAHASPANIDELIGVMKRKSAKMGGIILDSNPTDGMVQRASGGKFLYKAEKTPSGHQDKVTYDKVQIITVDEVLSGGSFKHPRTD